MEVIDLVSSDDDSEGIKNLKGKQPADESDTEFLKNKRKRAKF